MKKTVARQAMEQMAQFPYPLTATQLCKLTGIRLDTLSSALRKLVTKGKLVRVPNYGPRGGYGYRLRTQEEMITQEMAERISLQIDQEILEELQQGLYHRPDDRR